MREIDSPNRSSAAVSLVACTNRVAMLPRSLQSISITESCRSSNSRRRHLAAARFRFAMRSRTNDEDPAGTNKDEPFDQEFSCRRLPAQVEPKNPEGQGRIDRALRLGSIHAQQRKGGLTLPQQATRVNRTKRSLQINSGGEAGDRVPGKMSFDGPFSLASLPAPPASPWESAGRAPGRFLIS
jgi:hypothetical protein